jgi:hypothetical protein
MQWSLGLRLGKGWDDAMRGSQGFRELHLHSVAARAAVVRPQAVNSE